MITLPNLPVDVVKAFTDNYIWLIHAAADQQVIIVDPGDATPVLEAIAQQSLTPVAILITHHHADHTGGVANILEQYALPVFGPADENINSISEPVDDGRTFTVTDKFPPIQVLDTGGHTPGHISYLIDNALFCGDTLFAGGCGRLLGGTADQLFASLNRIMQLPDDTAIFCAHEYTEANLKFAVAVEPGNRDLQKRYQQVKSLRSENQPTVPSDLRTEKNTNPFLRCTEVAVRKAAEKQAGQTLETPLAVFKTLRSWKDNFRPD